MKKTLFTLLCTLIALSGHMQPLGWRWAKAGVNGGKATTEATTFAPDGGVYAAGSFTGSFAIGDSAFNAGPGSDLYICRYEPGGAVDWVRHLDGAGDLHCTAILSDPGSDAVYVAVSYDSVAWIGANQFSSGGFTDAILLKYRGDGSLLWAKTFGGAAARRIGSLALDAHGALLMSGEFGTSSAPTVPFGSKSLTAYSSTNVFALKADTSGSVSWIKAIGTSGRERLGNAGVDGAGNIYVFGSFENRMMIDSVGLNSISEGGAIGDLFFLKLDALGRLAWIRAIGGVPTSGGSGGYGGNGALLTGITGAVDDSGNLVLAGECQNVDVIFGKRDFTGFVRDGGWMARFDSSGTRIWSKGVLLGLPRIAIDPAGDIFFSGAMRSIRIGDSVCYAPASVPNPGMCLAKASSAGVLQWARFVGDMNVMVDVSSLAVSADNEIVTSGAFFAAPLLSFDRYNCFSGNTSRNGFLARFGKLNATGLVQVPEGALDVYPNPARGELNLVQAGISSFGRYRLLDAMGRQVVAGTLQQVPQQQIALPALAAGMYYLELASPEYIIRRSVIINP